MKRRPPARSRVWLLAGLITAAAALAAAIAAGVAGRDAPQAPAVTYRLVDGERLSTAALRGSRVLVNFWSTSCRVCIAEMPSLARLHRDFAGRDFTVIAVAVAWDPPSAVLDYLRRTRPPFPVALDWDGTTAAAFGGITGTPLTFLIDRDGAILARQEGTIDIGRLRRLLEESEAG